MKKGLIVLGHGSRAPAATETLAEITALVGAEAPFARVKYASLQLSLPDLPTVVEEMAREGMEEITVVPLLIAAGVHFHEDIPALLTALGKNHPGVRLRLASPLGADPRLAAIVLERAAAAETLA